jgi:DNA repair exonuclease SbcCD ATPase subunit
MATTSICSICLDPLIQQDCCAIVPCGHTWHERCLKRWSLARFKEGDPERIVCPYCNTTVQNVIKIFLSTKSGHDDSLSGKELENWRNEYDAETKGERLHLHAKVLESNKKVIDDIFEKQKILEAYERDRTALDSAKVENYQLRKELFQQIMKHEVEMRRMESNKLVIQEVLERNEKALQELNSTRAENLDLKRELLRHIMGRQDDMKKLAASKQALQKALESHEATLNELKNSREESLSLKKELVEHLHHHKQKMEQLQYHKESLQEIVCAHKQNVVQLEYLSKENLKLKEELLNCILQRKKDATKLAKCEGWIEVLKEEVESFDEDRQTLKLIRSENYRLGTIIQERHKSWIQARRDLNAKVQEIALVKMNWLTIAGQVVLLGLAVHNLRS